MCKVCRCTGRYQCLNATPVVVRVEYVGRLLPLWYWSSAMGVRDVVTASKRGRSAETSVNKAKGEPNRLKLDAIAIALALAVARSSVRRDHGRVLVVRSRRRRGDAAASLFSFPQNAHKTYNKHTERGIYRRLAVVPAFRFQVYKTSHNITRGINQRRLTHSELTHSPHPRDQ